jgi:hypothetical protein
MVAQHVMGKESTRFLKAIQGKVHGSLTDT